jgi:DNA polymerase-1
MLGTVLKTFLPPKKRDPRTGMEIYVSGLPGYVKRDGRLHTSIGQMIKTGRLSSSNPNLQNMPNRTEGNIEDIFAKYAEVMGGDKFYKLRSAFTAKDGHLLVAADYKLAEIATLAFLRGFEYLIKAVVNSEVIHSVVGRQMFNKNQLTNDEFKEQHKPLRVAAKSIVFGLLYGRGAMAISREVEKAGIKCSYDDAKEFMAQFMDGFPKIQELIDRTHEQVEDRHWVEGVWGRRAFYYDTGASGDDANSTLARQKRQSFNFLMQNYVGDLLRKTLINLARAKRNDPLANFDVVLTVYDSVMYEVPITSTEYVVGNVIPSCMTKESYCEALPFEIAIDIDVSQRWDESNTVNELMALGLSEEFANIYGKEPK